MIQMNKDMVGCCFFLSFFEMLWKIWFVICSAHLGAAFLFGWMLVLIHLAGTEFVRNVFVLHYS